MDVCAGRYSRYINNSGVIRAMAFVKSNIKVLLALLGLVVLGTATMSFISFNYDSLQLDAITWLFVQSLCLYIAYLCFQSIFFDRFIAVSR